MLPNFIIPGAQKSGTTALRIYLAQHPDIYMVSKEIHFFDDEENYRKGIEWYEKFFDDCKGERAIGEKTPEYLYDERVSERIYKVLPNVKLIFVLRNPVDRAYSHYWHNVRSGLETLSFEKAIEKEEERTKNPEFKKIYSYKDRGKYILQIKRYANFFPKSNMLFVLAEDLKEDRKNTLKKILKFLNLEPDFEFKDLKEKHVGGIPRSKFLARLAGNEYIRKHRILKDFIKRINTKRGKIPPMKRNTRKYLEIYFEEYNRELEKFAGIKLDKWPMK
ncbi:MAG TPA: sulfotransferase [Thermoplasmata archaeon]|nr:sulfotransferase [Thermoplasmata archaeon]